jgi:hypothetical protein
MNIPFIIYLKKKKIIDHHNKDLDYKSKEFSIEFI